MENWYNSIVMEKDNFQKNLLKHTEDFRKVLATSSGDWSVKGFIDIAKNIYTMTGTLQS